MKSKKYKLSAIVFYSVILALALGLPNMAFALQSGDFYYTVSGGTVTINGLTSQACELTPTEVIPDTIDGMPVVAIGDWAFSSCSLTSVTIPNSVTSIGNNAFSYSGLTSVTIPNSVTSIGGGAFVGCKGLTSVTISSSVTSIVIEAFANCSNLTSIVVDASNTVYSSLDGVLYDKDRTVLIQYPNGKSGGFTIPNSVTSIGNFAFKSCTGLTSVTIPDSVTSIGDYAFYYCSGLTSVTIPNSVTSIGGYALYYCIGLTSVTIPDGVTSIGGSAFDGCTSLTNVTIGNSVTSIGYYAFYQCTVLTTAYFHGNAPSMGGGVFNNCASHFTICYTAGSTGFTTPTWYGYPAAVCTPTTTTTIMPPPISTTTTVTASTTTTTPPTVIELSSFTATPKAGEVILQWSTESETDNAGFNIYRSEAENGQYTKINFSIIPAQGSSTQGASYEFTDTNVQNRKTYYYKLEDIDLNGQSTMHGPVSAMPRLILGFWD